MKHLKLTVDVALPGMAGGTTTDLATIQRNILSIQNLLNKRIYNPGDIRSSNVLVVTGVYQFICVINLKIREMSGYMSFINSRKSEFTALDVFHLLCPVKEDETEMEERFLDTYRALRDAADGDTLQAVYFIGGRQSANVEMMY